MPPLKLFQPPFRTRIKGLYFFSLPPFIALCVLIGRVFMPSWLLFCYEGVLKADFIFCLTFTGGKYMLFGINGYNILWNPINSWMRFGFKFKMFCSGFIMVGICKYRSLFFMTMLGLVVRIVIAVQGVVGSILPLFLLWLDVSYILCIYKKIFKYSISNL